MTDTPRRPLTGTLNPLDLETDAEGMVIAGPVTGQLATALTDGRVLLALEWQPLDASGGGSIARGQMAMTLHQATRLVLQLHQPIVTLEEEEARRQAGPTH